MSWIERSNPTVVKGRKRSAEEMENPKKNGDELRIRGQEAKPTNRAVSHNLV